MNNHDLTYVASVVKRTTNIPITNYIKIKKYLKTQEKITFVKDYTNKIKELLETDEYEEAEAIIAFVFFNLLVVKAYTDLEFDLNFESFDLLQENGLIEKIVAEIGDDYTLLLNFVRV